MVAVYPFHGLRPQTQVLQKMIAPPYDVVDVATARQLAIHPYHFLHLTKPEIDCTQASAYTQQAQKNLQQLLDDKILQQDEQASFYLYQMISSHGVQTGIALLLGLQGGASTLRIHEYTQPDKQQYRAALIDAQQAQLSPVMLTYRDDANLTALMQEITSAQPLSQAQLNAVEYRLWQVSQAEHIQLVTQAFADIPALYIADGHHRSAAAQSLADRAKHQVLFAICFPQSCLKVLAYHRACRCQHLSLASVQAHLEKDFNLQWQAEPYLPTRMNEYGCYFSGRWAALTCPQEHELPVKQLHHQIIEPLLGIKDPRTDPNITFVGGDSALIELMNQVDQGEMDIAFTCYPTSIEQLMQVADQNDVLPPKSTWFEPKLADGLVAFQYEE